MPDQPDSESTPQASPPPDDEALLAAYVGPNWDSHYRERFAAFAAGTDPRPPRVNPAAVFAPMWLAWRGFWVLQFGANIVFLFIIAFLAASADSEAGLLMALAAAYVVLGTVEGASGDRLVFWRARRALAGGRARGLDGDDAAAAMRKAGGVSVVGVFLVPALTWLAFDWVTMAGHHHDHERAYAAAMKSDLRNLVTAEESYFADSVTYSATLVTDSGAFGGYGQSTGVTVTIGVATGTGWNATAKHERTAWVCAIYVGDAPPPRPAANEGEPKCELPKRD